MYSMSVFIVVKQTITIILFGNIFYHTTEKSGTYHWSLFTLFLKFSPSKPQMYFLSHRVPILYFAYKMKS